MTEKFNANLLKALASSKEAVENCREAMMEAKDESCRAMYTAIKKDCERHIQMLESEIELHKNQDKWEN